MSQLEVLNFLRKNPNMFFSAENISKLVDINMQSVYSSLKRLEAELATISVTGKASKVTKLYCFKQRDDDFEDILHEVTALKNDPKYLFYNLDILTLLKILDEIKKIRKVIENGSKFGNTVKQGEQQDSPHADHKESDGAEGKLDGASKASERPKSG